MPDHVLVALDEMQRYMPYLGGFAYIRPTFVSAGLDQFTSPPAQDEDLLTVADNLAPAVTSILQRGWGYQLFGNFGFSPARFSNYQRDQDGLRLIIGMSMSLIAAMTESGSVYSSIFTPSAGASTPRFVPSRGLGFIVDGLASDLVKWNGMAAPTAPSLNQGTGGSWPSGTYYVAVTLLDEYSHESLPGPTQSITLSSGATLVVTTPPSQTLLAQYRVYVGTSSGALHLQVTVAVGTNANMASYNSSGTAPPTADGLIVTNVCGNPPETAVGLEEPVSGQITLTVGRIYVTAFYNSATGQTTDFSPLSASTGPLTNQNQPIVDIPQPADPQFDQIYILATSDGGNVNPLYFLASLPVGANSYTDSTTDDDLVAADIYNETSSDGTIVGIENNSPPPVMNVLLKAGGRMFGISGEFLFFSKSLSEVTTSTGTVTCRYEECWPPDNQMDVSGQAEIPHSLYWDGQIVYIGTNENIWRLTGTSALDFSEPQVRFAGCGVLNQETWQQIFIQDQPVGAMWLTPDFRVIMSDMNDYQDVSGPVRPYLDDVNKSVAANVAQAAFVANDAYDLYMLAIPTGTNTTNDTILVFDLRHSTWWVRLPTDAANAFYFYVDVSGSPHTLLGSGDTVWDMQPDLLQDRTGTTPVTTEVNIQTAWLDCGDPQIRKAPWEMQVCTEDPGLTCDVYGALVGADFASPIVVATGLTLITDTVGVTKYPLADYASTYRHLQFTFHSTANVQNVLQYYSLIATGVGRE